MSFIKMTFSGSLMILIVIIIRSLITYRLPKRALLVFWGMVLFRLLVPYNVPTDIHAFLPVNPAIFSPERLADPDNEIISSGTVGESIDIAKRTADAFVMRQVDADLPRVLIVEFNFWNAVWIAGMVLAAVFFVIAYLKWYREYMIFVNACCLFSGLRSGRRNAGVHRTPCALAVGCTPKHFRHGFARVAE